MLRFKSWPPEVGQVEFSTSTTRSIKESQEARDALSESDRTIMELSSIGFRCGQLVVANTDMFTAQRVGHELSKSIEDDNDRDIFLDSYGNGILDEIQGQKEVDFVDKALVESHE